MNTTPSDARPQIAHPPRIVSARVRRRAWNDPIARFFLLTCIVLVFIASVFCITGINLWLRESNLIRLGIPLDATIHGVVDSTQGLITRANASADPSSPVLLQFNWEAQTYTTHHARPLDGYTKSAIVGDKVRIRVDAKNPEDWTALAEPTSLQNQTRIMGAILILPAALAAFVAAAWRRRGLARLWQHGVATPSLLVSSSISPLSPLGRAARCTPLEEGDSRVFTVYLQGREAAPEPGETIELLARPAPSQRAVAAEFFA